MSTETVTVELTQLEELDAAADEYRMALGLIRDLLKDAERIYEPGFEDPPHIVAARDLTEHEGAIAEIEKVATSQPHYKGEGLRERLLEIQSTCQEVAHEVEDPLQAVTEIEALTRKALAALNTANLSGEGLTVEAISEQVHRDLHSDGDGTKGLDGQLGQAIADAAGSWSLEFITPEQLAEGIGDWLAAAFPDQRREK